MQHKFIVSWDSEQWRYIISDGRISPSYGVVVHAKVITWSHQGCLLPLRVIIRPFEQELMPG